MTARKEVSIVGRCVRCHGPAKVYDGLRYCSTFSCGYREIPGGKPTPGGAA